MKHNLIQGNSTLIKFLISSVIPLTVLRLLGFTTLWDVFFFEISNISHQFTDINQLWCEPNKRIFCQVVMPYVKLPLKSVLIKMDLAPQNTRTKSCYFVNPTKAHFKVLSSVRISLEHLLYPDSGIPMDEEIVLGNMIWSYNKAEL